VARALSRSPGDSSACRLRLAIEVESGAFASESHTLLRPAMYSAVVSPKIVLQLGQSRSEVTSVRAARMAARIDAAFEVF
jgi:hypothetical protein